MAILTNPYHRDGLADDMNRALSMPADERRALAMDGCARPCCRAPQPAGPPKKDNG